MSPLQFEARHAPDWQRLAEQLDALEAGRPGADAAVLLKRYRLACEHLALVQARAWPLHLAERLGSLTQRAHRQIYREPPASLARLARLVRVQFPRRLRAHPRLLLLATLAFFVPLVASGVATWFDPAFALTVMDAQQLSQFDAMYGDDSRALGRERGADSDWMMFGFYIRNNISVAFQCFATGLVFGVGTLFFLVANGVLIGVAAGYLTARGLGHNFWPFVATHGAFELTAIVIAGMAGLMLGRALLAPGRDPRGAALRQAARRAAVLVGGAVCMLVVAAVLEAFWSSARWVADAVKYGVAAACWAGVIVYFWRSGSDAVNPD
jgi:uncharacterized membrane protein SpoIIM required for sporulation